MQKQRYYHNDLNYKCVFRQVRYLKIIEKSGYQALPWVRYITQSGGESCCSLVTSHKLPNQIRLFPISCSSNPSLFTPETSRYSLHLDRFCQNNTVALIKSKTC